MIYFILAFIVALKIIFSINGNNHKSKKTVTKTDDMDPNQNNKKQNKLCIFCGDTFFVFIMTILFGSIFWLFIGGIVTATFVKTEEVVLVEYKLVSLDGKSFEQNGKYLNTRRGGKLLRASYAINETDGIHVYENTMSDDFDFYVIEDSSIEPNIKKYGNHIINRHPYDFIFFTNILFEGSYYTKTVLTVPEGNLSDIYKY